MPSGVRLSLDDGTATEGSTAGITWHLDLNGRQLPFGDGMTFVRVGVDGLITYIRCVFDPARKAAVQ